MGILTIPIGMRASFLIMFSTMVWIPAQLLSDSPIDSIKNSIGLVMIKCPPGQIQVGSPEDEFGRDDDEAQMLFHIPSILWVADSEVTQEMYRQIVRHPDLTSMMREMSGGKIPKQMVGEQLPMVFISYFDACRFCVLLTQFEREQEAIGVDQEYRLLSEPEWEYIARAKDRRGHGDAGGDVTQFAVFSENAEGTLAIRSKKPNLWNIYDCQGNVFEWCRTIYQGPIRAPKMMSAAEVGSVQMVVKGGSWASRRESIRIAERVASPPYRASKQVGFRVVLAYRSEK